MQGDMRVLRTEPTRFWLDTEAVAGDAVLRHLSMYKVGRDVESTTSPTSARSSR